MFKIFANGEPMYEPGNTYRTVCEPMVTIELGKAGSLTCDLPPGNDCYDRIGVLKTKVKCELDGDVIFSGRLLSVEKGFENVKTLYCEGFLSYLIDSVQKLSAYTGTTHELFGMIIDGHNQRIGAGKQVRVGRITVENRAITIRGQSDGEGTEDDTDFEQIAIDSITNDWDTTYDLIETCLIDYCGGYLSAREEDGEIFIDYLADEGEPVAQDVRFGVNMLDLTDETNVEDYFNVLIPLGNENLTIASVNGGSDELVDEDGVARYGGRIVRTHVFDSVTDAGTLMENGLKYMQERETKNRTITITAIDMHMLNPDIPAIHVGDKVRVSSAPHGIGDILTCTKIEYDLENPGNTQYTFGNPTQTLTQRYRKNRIESEKAATAAAAAGGGGSGGRAKAEAEEELENFYKEWINIDPNNPDGVISLGTLYDHVVQSTVAINGKVDENHAMLEMHTVFISEQSEALTRITERTTASEAQIDILAEYTKENDTNIASIILTANEHGSAIDFNADRISLNANDILELNSEMVSVKKLIADEIEAVIAKIQYAVTGSISAKDITTSGNAWVQGSVITSSVSAGSITFDGSDVSKSTLPVVTSFTQASGETAPTTNYTLLTTSFPADERHKPDAGSVTRF